MVTSIVTAAMSIPSVFRAIRVAKFGTPEVLKVAEMNGAEGFSLAPNQVRVPQPPAGREVMPKDTNSQAEISTGKKNGDWL